MGTGRMVGRRFFGVGFIVGINLLGFQVLAAAQRVQPAAPAETEDARIKRIVNNALDFLDGRVNQMHGSINGIIARSNESLALSHSANGKAIEAFETATRASDLARQSITQLESIRNVQASVGQEARVASEHLEHDYQRLHDGLVREVEQTQAGAIAAIRREQGLAFEDKIHLEEVKIQEKQRRGIYQQAEKMRAQAVVDVEKEKWRNVRDLLGDSSVAFKVVCALAATALCVYSIKYGIPALIDYMQQPCVISETSKTGIWGRFLSTPQTNIDDLIFAPAQQKQLSELLDRIQTAKKYKENLPNLLFYGPSGTGKTAFAKALAYSSGFDYALTSGSEFAKIKDLSHANDELRKLLKWAKNNKQGLLVFIDEAESLFANRKLPSTPKITQDFINTFLSLIPDQAQKKVMFIFATNHPFKFDDAITNRVGIHIGFALPALPEREKILFMYLVKYAQENKDFVVSIHPEVRQKLSLCAGLLGGVSPRALKFIAEAMIIAARRQKAPQLTYEIAKEVVDTALKELRVADQWKKERDKWVGMPLVACA